MAQNINIRSEGKAEKEKETEGEKTFNHFEEFSVSEREKKTSKCESCVSKRRYDRVAVFLCLGCEIYVCADCMDGHRSHVGMEELRKKSERKVKGEEMAIWGKKREGEEREQREKRENKKPEVWDINTKRVTKTSGKTVESEQRKSENEGMKELSARGRMLENFVDQLLSESQTERKNKLKNTNVSICDRVEVKHELDQERYCFITGLCGLENRRWVACDCCNSCIKIFKLGSHVLQRYIRFVGSWSKPWDVTEIHFTQNSTELGLVSGSNSGISVTDRADPDKPCFVAVTLPWERQIMFIDVSKKPAFRHNVIFTEERCRSIQFYDGKIFTVCGEGFGSRWFVYIKSTDGDTLHMFYIGTYNFRGYFPGPYLAVVSGRVYLTDRERDRVQCRNVEGRIFKEITIRGSEPVGISVDSDNNMYVCARGHNRVYKLDSDLTRYKSVLDQTADYVKGSYALCYYRDKLFISHNGLSSFDNFVTVVRLL